MKQYISPAVASSVRVCIDTVHEDGWNGRICTRLSERDIQFRNIHELINVLEGFWNILGYPQESTITRSFGNQQNAKSKWIEKIGIQVEYEKPGIRDKIVVEISEEDMDMKNGEKGTFIVNIRYRQNSTWQGHVTWVEENKTVPFRSALELIKLLDSTQGNTDEWESE